MGPYDNEGDGGTGCHVEDPNWLEGQWLVDEDGVLYIVPKDGDGVEGPDDSMCAEILTVLQDAHADRLSEDRAHAMGLTEVADVLKRFSPEIGYYSA